MTYSSVQLSAPRKGSTHLRRQALVASSAIRHAEVDGCRVILDLRSESYRALDYVGSAMWSILTGESDKAASMEALSNSYDLDVAVVEADLLAFAKRCVAEGLLEPASVSHGADAAAAGAMVPRKRRGRSPGALGALRCVLATRHAISRNGFRATYERYALIPVEASHHRLVDALPAFIRAETFWVARRAPDDCLLRSLSLYRFLREAGIPAAHVIGVRRFPFQAHAWVECRGGAVADDRAHDFTPLARIGATPLCPAHTQ